MRPVSIVVLSKYKDVFEGFIKSVSKFAGDFPKIVVADGKEPMDALDSAGYNNFEAQANGVVRAASWTIIPGPEKFAMAGNCNLGWKAVPEDHDILYCGDDVRFIQEGTIERLQEIAYSKDNIGILSPKLVGRGSPSQINPPGKLASIPPLHMWFPCVYIKRELINKIGYLDERFNDFGCDDFDYCIRALQSNFILAVTSEIAVEHEASPEGGPTTFVKKLGVGEFNRQQREAQLKIAEKYHMSTPVFNDFLRTGNLALLENDGKNIQIPETVGPDTPKEQAAAYLRSRHIFIATPAYGGQFAVNYVNSLVSLIDTCKNLGIVYTTSFLYNESLITRARNKLADLFMKKTEATDFFFIDADIGFNAQDIISLLFHKEEIIAVPCARKNLRLDRVYNAGKANHPANSIPELRKLCGEFVINFPPDNVPSGINLGQLIEVQDGGTGLMRIKRSAFEKFATGYPDRWYLPMAGEEGENGGGRLPMYMYFQSRMDEDSQKFNPGGFGDYISEDYAFCRDARKLGMKVFAAPWVKTSHMGSYMFEGDLTAVQQAGGFLR